MRQLAFVLFVGLFAACSATRSVRPVGEDQWAFGGSLGGPLFTNLGPPIPAPMVSGYARHGLSEKTDLDAALYLPVARVMGLELGASHLFLDQQGKAPAVMGGGRLVGFFNPLGFTGAENPNGGGYGFAPRLFEELYANASWRVGEKSLAWVGLDLFVQAEQLLVRPSLVVGFEWRATDLFGLTIEAKQLSFLSNQEYAAVAFIGPASYGAFALQLGFNFYPGSH